MYRWLVGLTGDETGRTLWFHEFAGDFKSAVDKAWPELHRELKDYDNPETFSATNVIRVCEV